MNCEQMGSDSLAHCSGEHARPLNSAVVLVLRIAEPPQLRCCGGSSGSVNEQLAPAGPQWMLDQCRGSRYMLQKARQKHLERERRTGQGLPVAQRGEADQRTTNDGAHKHGAGPERVRRTRLTILLLSNLSDWLLNQPAAKASIRALALRLVRSASASALPISSGGASGSHIATLSARAQAVLAGWLAVVRRSPGRRRPAPVALGAAAPLRSPPSARHAASLVLPLKHIDFRLARAAYCSATRMGKRRPRRRVRPAAEERTGRVRRRNTARDLLGGVGPSQGNGSDVCGL